jgi:cell wall-associated NlpC family hydrolase
MPACSALRRFLATLPALLTLSLALSLLVATPAHARTVRDRKIHHAVQVAIDQKGDPYGYGYAGPNRFDCSGLTMFSYGRAGLSLPRTAAAQYQSLRHIHHGHMHRGDLMYFHDGGGYVYHAAIFLGRHDGHIWILHASRPGTPVKRDPVWTRSWYGATFRPAS